MRQRRSVLLPRARARARAVLSVFQRARARLVQELRQSRRWATRRSTDDWTTRLQRFAETDSGFDLVRYPPHLFVTSPEWRALHPINARMGPLIDNKGFLPVLAAAFPEVIPDTFIYVMGDRLVVWRDGCASVRTRQALAAIVAERLQEKGPLVLRPLGGSGGSGVSLVTSVEQLARHQRERWQFILTTHLRPAAYSAAVWPDSLNTLRLYGHRSRDGGARLFRMFQRFGTRASGLIDHLPPGGLAAPVDLTTGRIGQARRYEPAADGGRRLGTIDVHPDSGVRIQGTSIPQWEELRGHIDRMVDGLSFLTYFGIDAAVTPDGLKLIEVNSLPGVRLLQLEEPALVDEEFRELFLELRGSDDRC